MNTFKKTFVAIAAAATLAATALAPVSASARGGHGAMMIDRAPIAPASAPARVTPANNPGSGTCIGLRKRFGCGPLN
jgi:hypothetical protein